MSTVKTPTEKKRLAYERDHYNRNGESNKAWRKAKPPERRMQIYSKLLFLLAPARGLEPHL